MREKIELYQVRSFSDKLSAVFAFFGENWRVLLKYLVYFLLPLSLVQPMAMNGYISGALTLDRLEDEAGEGLIKLAGSMGAMIALYTIGSMLMMVIVYALMRVYRRRENRLLQLSWDELRPDFWMLVRRCLFIMVFSIAITIVIGLIMLAFAYVIHPAMVLVVILLIIPVCIPLALLYPIYFFEDDTTLFQAIGKAFHLGFPTWGGIFGILIVLSFLGSFVSGAISLPWTILTVMKTLLSADADNYSFINSVGYSFLLYLLGIVQAFVGYFAYSLPFIGLAYQYGHACEKVDHVTIDNDINRFEQL